MSYTQINTLSTTTPAQGDAQVTMASGMDCLVIDTGPADITEPFFYLYVRIDNGTVKKILTECYFRHILPVAAGATVSIGSDQVRAITVRQSLVPTLMTPENWETAASFSDQSEPRVWVPVSRHIATSTIKKIIILPEVSGWKDIFISDYDGSAWSPARWIRTHPTYTPSGVTVPVFGIGVALCTQDGAIVSVKLSADSTAQGESHPYALPMPTITSQVVVTANDGADFLSKLQAATAGTEVVLPAGIYTLASQVTESDWAQGVTVSGQTGVADDVIIEGANVNDALRLHQVGWSMLRGFRNATWSISADHRNAAFDSVGVRVSNIKFQGDGTGSANLVNCRVSSASDRKFFNCEFNDSAADGINTDQGDPVWLIRCRGARAGSTANDQVVTAHNSSQIYVLGGHYQDANTNVMASASGGRQYCELMSYSKGARNTGMLNTDMRGCRSASHSVSIVGSNWLTRNIWDAAFLNMFRNSLAELWSNMFFASTATRVIFYDASSGHPKNYFNMLIGSVVSSEAPIWHSGGSAGADGQLHANWTVENSSRMIGVHSSASHLLTALNSAAKNITGAGSVSNSGIADPTKFASDYNVWSTVPGTTFAASENVGANDVIDADAQTSTELIPTASGNCDNTGDPTLYDWIGGRGPTCQPLIYDLGVSSRGALTRPQSGEIFPDVWNSEAVAASQEQDPDPEDPPVATAYLAVVRGAQNKRILSVFLANGVNASSLVTGTPTVEIFNFARESVTGEPKPLTLSDGMFSYEHPTNILTPRQHYYARFSAVIDGESRPLPEMPFVPT